MVNILSITALQWLILSVVFQLSNILKPTVNVHKYSKAPVPEQVHISLGTNQSEMIITWSTLYPMVDDALVEYGRNENQLTQVAKAEVTLFKEISLYTYRALLSNLEPLTYYYYRVGSNASNWSEMFQFRSISDHPNWLPTLAVYGDLGYQNQVSLPFLIKEVHNETYNAMFHLGDFAYDLDFFSGIQGNLFMNSIQPAAAKVPYLTCPGNHEEKSNFSHYDARFSMLADRYKPANSALPLSSRLNNHYHSLDIGPVHVILFSTEFYYYTQFGWEQIKYQYEWLEQDLIRANQNRASRPWIFAMSHRPMYCFNMFEPSCNMWTLERSVLRHGIQMYGDKNASRQYGLEKLFLKYGVDVQFHGHEHNYIRMKIPVYEEKNNARNQTNGPVHITTGSAGNIEHHFLPINPLIWFQKYVAAYHYDYGYTRIRFLDRLHLVLEQTSIDKGGIVADKMEIIKQSERPNWMT